MVDMDGDFYVCLLHWLMVQCVKRAGMMKWKLIIRRGLGNVDEFVNPFAIRIKYARMCELPDESGDI